MLSLTSVSDFPRCFKTQGRLFVRAFSILELVSLSRAMIVLDRQFHFYRLNRRNVSQAPRQINIVSARIGQKIPPKIT